MHTYSKNPLRPHVQAASSFFPAAHAVISNAAHWFAGSWLAKIFAVVAAERRALAECRVSLRHKSPCPSLAGDQTADGSIPHCA